MIKLYPTGLLILLLEIIIWCHILPLISLKADLARHDFNTTEFRNLSDYIMCRFSSHRGATPAIKKLLFNNSFLTKESCYLWAGERERAGYLRDNFTSEFQIGSPSALKGIANSDQSRVSD